LEIGPRCHVFLANFLACTDTAIKLLPVKFLTPNLKPPWAVSYSTTNFGGAYYTIYACFERKTAFVMQNFWNLGDIGGGGELFDETPKKPHPWLISRVLSLYACKSVPGFFIQASRRKKGPSHLFAQNSPLNQI